MIPEKQCPGRTMPIDRGACLFGHGSLYGVDDAEGLMRDRLAMSLRVLRATPVHAGQAESGTVAGKMVDYFEVEDILTGSEAVQSYCFSGGVRE